MAGSTKYRFHFVDLLRGWATIMMIETHAVNAYMDVVLRAEGWFWYVNFINGLIAPSFIFISGFAFRIVTDRKWEQYQSWTPVFRKQFLRLLFILVLGYAMHLPLVLLKDWSITMPEGFSPFFKVDVLHIISLSLIALQFLVLLFRSQRAVVIASVVIGLGFTIFSPLAWQHDFTKHLGLFLGNYFNSDHQSLFPAFPWASYAFLGYAVAHFFMREYKAERSFLFMKKILWGSVAGVAGAILLHFYPIHLFGETTPWITNPAWLLIRISLVCILLTVMWYYEKNFYPGKFSVVGIFGQNSLMVYALHLAMIYGSFGLPKLSRSNFHHLSFGMSIATTSLIFIVMLLLTYWWSRPREERKKHWKYFAAAAVLWGGLAIFWESVVDSLEPNYVTSRPKYILSSSSDMAAISCSTGAHSLTDVRSSSSIARRTTVRSSIIATRE